MNNNPENDVLVVDKARKGMLLHCGAKIATMEEISQLKVPPATKTWFPIPRQELVNNVLHSMEGLNMRVKNQVHALSQEGLCYFGVFELEHANAESNDYSWVVGLRNSNNKKYPAGLVAGTRVFVCDNLAFSGEVKFSRKHTPYILRDLPRLASTAVSRIGERFVDMDTRITMYKQC